ncbi:VOC family protein [Streptomyces albidus (ex Kaewkla and Franco 2022)]|uniref:VOC family protein n=1 Tax=Streptomyces albidus (ex Kaewkla and Franco 2022) TaxID=722709 RepID=UPI0015EEEF35|nr:VOC family protein [Streptomyces albidus (ex Kaewkla and Franco 2022)]
MAVLAETFAEGVPCWADAMLSDVEAGKRFYGELFGWTFGEGETERNGYVTAVLDGRSAAGLFAKSDGRLPTVWNLHLATGDAFAAVARIREAGGNVLTEPSDAGRPGHKLVAAVAADPSGAVFGLLQTGGPGGFGVRGEHGAYVWSEVHTRDKDAVDAFYTDVFGYGMRDLTGLDASGDGPTDEEHGGEADLEGIAVWAAAGDPVDEEHAIAGRCLIGGTYPAEMPAHFLTYFAVDDCDAAAHTAVRLGGRVLREPEETPFGRYGVLVDDQGASFAVLQAPASAPGGAA